MRLQRLCYLLKVNMLVEAEALRSCWNILILNAEVYLEVPAWNSHASINQIASGHSLPSSRLAPKPFHSLWKHSPASTA